MECRESKSSSTLFGISCDPAGCAGKEFEFDDLTFVGDGDVADVLVVQQVASPLVMTVMLLLLEVELELTLLS